MDENTLMQICSDGSEEPRVIPIRMDGQEASTSSREMITSMDVSEISTAESFIKTRQDDHHQKRCTALSLSGTKYLHCEESGCENLKDSENNCGVEMDAELWCHLPIDLIERILAALPITAFFRLRSVCKRWRVIMYTKGFVESCAQMPAKGPFFLKVARCRCRVLASYDPVLKQWRNIPVGFLPTQVSVPAASSRGLICFIATQYMEGYSVLLVCNPMTRCWRALPPMISRRYPFVVSMFVDRSLNTYKIIVAGDYNSFEHRRTTEVYDSSTSSWRLCGTIPPQEEITKNIVACNGHLFCLSRGPGNGLLVYNLEQGSWSKLKTGRMPGYSKFRHLVECKGKVLIVGKALRRHVLGFYVWRLDTASMKWREVGKMPQNLSEQFFRTPSECFYCSGHGDLIFVSRFFCDRGLVYDISRNCWEWVSDCPKVANPFILPLEPGFDNVY